MSDTERTLTGWHARLAAASGSISTQLARRKLMPESLKAIHADMRKLVDEMSDHPLIRTSTGEKP